MENEQPPSSTEPEEIETGTAIKNILLTVGGVVLVMSILVLLPMLLTYLSEGDPRP